MIIKEGKKWVVRGESGRKLGSYTTKAAAKKRLAQVEYFKNQKK